jgi:hypothetical protein
MSNVQSYNALIDRFKAFASGHFILKTFSHGQIDTADLEKFTEYPFMHVVPSNVTYAKGMKTFSFQIVLADLPRDKTDKVEFQREVLSDLQRIAEDLVAEITNHRVLFGDLITVQNVTLEPFLEEFHNTLTGWTVSLDLLVPYYWDACSIPAEWNDFFESGSGGTGSILTFIDSIVRDENGNVSLVNDEATPAPNYYYGTDDEGVRGWYLLETGGGLTCETIGDCQTIIDIEAAIDALEEEIVLKADITSISAVGFSNDYNDLDNLPTLPTGTVTSVGLTMPSAFSVANSPITSSGDIAVTGAGTVSQYVRGDGSLANFPASTGGGGSLSFYLNGSVSQGTFGGVVFREMDRTPILGAGTDFTIATNGYIQSFITDANVPNLLEIPAGNWNFETYFSASSNGGTPSYYIELYKWDGATLSLIASGSANPEGITNGTATHLYVSAIAVPQTALTVTDRLAVRIYVNNSGRTIKLHTENSHLCQVITTFSTGLTALNGLTAQVQNFATGTSGTDFGISSATSTHTFNLPTASAANRGALSSADWSAFNSKLSGLTVGTTPITSGTVGRVLFEGTGNVLQESANFFWDNTNSRLGIGTASPAYALDVTTDIRALRLYTNIIRDSNANAYINNTVTNAATTDISIGNATAASITLTSKAAGKFVFTTGNVLIGTTTDAGYKLDVNGTTRLNGLSSINGAGVANTALAVYGNGNGAGNYLFRMYDASAVERFYLTASGNFRLNGATDTSTTGTDEKWRMVLNFAPTSGTRQHNGIYLTQTINQTGGANGVTRGLLIEPTLTAAADYRAIETTVGKVCLNTTSGNTMIGTTTDAGFKLDVNGTARIQNDLTITDTFKIVSSTNANTKVTFASNLSLQGQGGILLQGGHFITLNGVVFGATSVNASAVLQADSTNRGFLPPRMTTTQKNAIATPAAGLVVYDTTLGKLCVRGASSWETITSL